VIDDHGRVVTRYDERMLSSTKVSYMYTPGTAVAIADIGRDHETLARSWRRTARGNRYAAAAASEDSRTSRDSF
jgi:malic enzyme